MWGKIGDALKNVLGLSGLAYVSGFIVVHAHFLRWGINESDWVDTRYIAAGAIFLFLALPTVLFPYLTGLAYLNELIWRVRGSFFSEPLQQLYVGNAHFINRRVGPFLVSICAFAALIEFYAPSGGRWQVLAFMRVFAVWYVASWLCTHLGVRVLNLAFYWRASALLALNPFWASFHNSFVSSFTNSFTRSFRLRNGRDPTAEELQTRMAEYVYGGVGAEGFLASALYKGVALFLLSATTFGAFVYPELPESIGGGRPQAVQLLLAGDQSAGLAAIGVSGTPVHAGSALGSENGKKAVESVQPLLSSALPLLAKTSDGYFVLISRAGGKEAVKIPASSVNGVVYLD